MTMTIKDFTAQVNEAYAKEDYSDIPFPEVIKMAVELGFSMGLSDLCGVSLLKVNRWALGDQSPNPSEKVLIYGWLMASIRIRS